MKGMGETQSCNCFTFIKRGHSQPGGSIRGLEAVAEGVKFYTFKELKLATNGFSAENKIGVGGFGSVYKGTLKDGTLVAVKQLSADSSQGVHEFVTEIALISKLKHENLVELLGCCVDQSQRILVYGYLQNNSIAHTLLGCEEANIDFDWPTRIRICVGMARGLAYLHEEVEPHIVHRDIKASNILLDKDLNPKISDFGLGKLFPDNVTHISTRVAGTIGYLAPEYAMRGQLTKKADIYSFGVLILEILSGRTNTNTSLSAEDQFLVEKVWKLYEEDRLLEILDAKLGRKYNGNEAARIIMVALYCTQAAATSRPNMKEVEAMISGRRALPRKRPSRPGFISDLRLVKMKANKDTNSSTVDSNSSRSSSSSATSSTLFTPSTTFVHSKR